MNGHYKFKNAPPPLQFWTELYTFLRWITDHLVRSYDGGLSLSVCIHELGEITFFKDLHPHIVPSFVRETEYLSLKRRCTFWKTCYHASFQDSYIELWQFHS